MIVWVSKHIFVKPQEHQKDKHVDTTGIDKGKCDYQERSQIRFGFLNAEKSAEVKVGEGATVLPY